MTVSLKMCKLCGSTYLVKSTPVSLMINQDGIMITEWTSIDTCGWCHDGLLEGVR